MSRSQDVVLSVDHAARGSGRVIGRNISHQCVNLRECPILRELRADAPGGGDLTGGQVRPPLAPDHFRQRANRLYVVRIASPGACSARRIRRPAENPRFRREIIQPILQYPAGSSERARAIEEAAWIVRVLPNGRSGRVADSPRNRRSWNGDRMVLPAHKQHLPSRRRFSRRSRSDMFAQIPQPLV